MHRLTFAPLIPLALALGITACSEEQPTVDRVQPGALAKSMFDGTWYSHATVIDTPYTSGATFVGEGTTLNKIIWEIQEHQIIARRSYQHIAASEEPGTASGRTEQGAPIVIYAVESHFDIRRAYSTTTGEELNVLEENTVDRPWYDREFVRVDWSRSLITDESVPITSSLAGAVLEPVNYYIQDPDDPWAPYFAEDDDGEVYYMDVVNKYFAKPTTTTIDIGGGEIREVPTCMLIFSSHLDCQPAEIAVRTSFLKVDTSGDYQPMEYTEAHMESFGYFLTTRDGYDRQYGTNIDARRRFTNRHNLWMASHRRDEGAEVACTEDADCEGSAVGSSCDMALAATRRSVEGACTIPFREREVRPIVYYLSANFPSELVPDAQRFADDWNGAFGATVGSLRVLECEDAGDADCEQERTRKDADSSYVLCGNPVSESDHAACGEVGLSPRIGDLRYNMLVWISEPHLSSPLGYGPSFADPETGQIISAAAYIYGAAMLSYTAYARDLIALINGDLAAESLTDNAAFGEWIRGLKDPAFIQASMPEGQRHVVDIDGDDAASISRSMSFDWMYQRAGIDPTGVAPPTMDKLMERYKQVAARLTDAVGELRMGDKGRARLHALRGTELEDLLVTDELRHAAGFGPSSLDDPAALQAASPLRGLGLDAMRAIDAAHRKLDVEHNTCVLNGSFADEGLLGLVREINRAIADGSKISWYGVDYEVADADGKIDYDLIEQMVRHPIFNAVAAHEVGHTIGLRHNFAGSYDAINYHPKYWRLRDDGNMLPRAWDPMTPDELNGRIREYEYSTVMDYGMNFVVTDAAGIGHYDKAAIKMGYGGLVEVFTDVPQGNSETISQVGALIGFGWPGALDLGAIVTGGPLRMIPYTEMPKLIGGIDALEAREDVRFSELVDNSGVLMLGVPTGDAEGRPIVPYRYCGDEFANFQPNCLLYDAGADEYEALTSIIDSYWNYYLFNNFQRQRIGFDPDTVPGRIYSRYFSKLENANSYYAYFRGLLAGMGASPEFFESPDGFGAFTTALGASYSLLNKVIATPEPGAYSMSSTLEGQDVYVSGGQSLFAIAGDVDISSFDGRALRTTYDLGPDTSFWYLSRAGFFHDKVMAMQVLLDAGGGFLGQDTQTDLRGFQTSFYTTFEQPTRNVFRGLITQDWDIFAPRLEGDDLVYPGPEEHISGGLSGTMVDPNLGFSLQLYATTLATTLLPQTFDQSFIDLCRLYVRGGAESVDLELEVGEVLIEYVDQDSGLVYMARSYPDSDGVEQGVAARMLIRAQALEDAGMGNELNDWMDNLNVMRRITWTAGFGGRDL